jgi:hypothetical protein
MPLKVLVCSHEGQRMGVVVDQILDVAQETVAVEERWRDSQSEGSAVVQKQVTDFLDLKAMLESAHGSTQSIDSLEAMEALQ